MDTSKPRTVMMMLLLWRQVQVQKAAMLGSRRGPGVIQVLEVIAHVHAHPTVARGLRLAGKAEGVVDGAVWELGEAPRGQAGVLGKV